MRISDSIPVLNQVQVIVRCVGWGLPTLLRYNNSSLCLGGYEFGGAVLLQIPSNHLNGFLEPSTSQLTSH